MNYLFNAFIALMAASTWASAATVTIRSGEHGDFTRLVFSLPSEDTKWDLREISDGYRLTLQEESITFDTKSVFSRITRQRLHTLEPGQKSGEIDLKLACDCITKTFVTPGALLVVDLHNKTQAEIANKPPSATGISQSSSFPTETKAVSSSTSKQQANQQKPEEPFVLLNPPKPDRQPSLGPLLKLSIDPTPDARPSEHTKYMLVRNLTQAIHQGLMNPKAPANPNGNEIASFSASSEKTPDPSIAISPNLATKNSIDQNLVKSVDTPYVNNTATACLSDDLFDLENWSTGHPLPIQISHWRRQLVGESGRLNPEAINKLAQVYLFFGFGAEARDILSLHDNETMATSIFLDIASLVDGTPVSQESALHDQLNCPERAAFWAVLSNSSINSDHQIKPRPVVAAFNALPAHLRQRFGPSLSKKLIDAGILDAAETVLVFARRGSPQFSPGLDLADAGFHMAQKNKQPAVFALNAAIDRNDQSSPQAIVDLVKMHAEDNAPFDNDMLSLISALSVENRNETFAPELRLANTIALSLSAQFETAAATIADIQDNDGEAAAQLALSQLFTRAVNQASDFDFLKLAFGQPSALLNGIEPGIANAVANRLRDLGFLKLARRMISESAAGDAGRARRILRGKIALDEQKPHRAEVEWIGLSGPDIEHLRAQADAQSGNYDAAYALFKSQNQLQDAELAAVMSGNWGVATGFNRPLVEEPSDVTIQDLPSPNSDVRSEIVNGALADHHQRLQQSIAVRETISRLLSQFQVSADGGGTR